MKQPLYWCFYDPERKLKTETLSTEQAQLFILRMKTKDVNTYSVWRSDWNCWYKLNHFISMNNNPFAGLNLLNAHSIIHRTANSVRMEKVSPETCEKIENSDNPLIESKSTDNDPIEIVLLSNKNQIFRTVCKHLDYSSIQCDRILPTDYLDSQFELVIIGLGKNGPTRIKLMASLDADDRGHKIKFNRISEFQYQLLADLIQYREHRRKNAS